MKLVMMLIVLVPALLQATILTVSLDGTQQYTSIQTAINASANNDTITVYPGTYYENVIINQRNLTLASLEMTTGDSTYIAQTIINGNQSGSCIRITQCDSVTVRGFYLTNGNGYAYYNSNLNTTRAGGGIYSRYSNLRLINNRIINNYNVHNGAGIYLASSTAFLSGTVLAYNHGAFTGGITYSGYPEDHPTKLTFDPINRSSIYLNTGTLGNDIQLANAADTVHIYLDRFSISPEDCEIIEFICNTYSNELIPYTLYYNIPVIVSSYADLYVSPNGNDSNSGLTSDSPLKTISWALLKIKADSLHQQTIHLADGVYSNSLNGQIFPLNPRSYVSIVGESETGTILDGDNTYLAIRGFHSEQKVKICNITFQNFTMPYASGGVVIQCISQRWNLDNSLRPLVYSMDNISIRHCHPSNPDFNLRLIEFVYPQSLSLKNIDIDNCSGALAISLTGKNIIGEDIRIRNYHYVSANNVGVAFYVSHNNVTYCNGPNVFSNLEITNCQNYGTDWGNAPIVAISGAYGFTSEDTFINATIADNNCSPVFGSGVMLSAYAKVNFVNSIISNNYPYNIRLYHSGYSEPVTLRLMNTLMNQTPAGLGNIRDDNPNHNVIEYLGVNLDTIPGFTNNPGNPYYLTQTSPCIDIGTTDFSPFVLPLDFTYPLSDLAGNPRIYGNQADLGAYEWCGLNNDDDISVNDKPYIHIYPNPCNSQAAISFKLKYDTDVHVSIYNVKGQMVKDFGKTGYKSGNNSLIWNGTDYTNKEITGGIYFIKLESGKNILTHKMVVIR